MQPWKLALAGVAIVWATSAAAPLRAESCCRHGDVGAYAGTGYRSGYGAYGYNYTREKPYYSIGTFYKPYNYSYPRYWWYYTPAYSYYGYHPYRWRPHAYFDSSPGWRPRSARYVKHVTHKGRESRHPAKKLK